MAEPHTVIESDPVIDAFKKDIDRTLLRENLKLTVAERLQKMRSAALGVMALRAALKKSQP